MFRFVSCILLAALLLLFSASTLPDISTNCASESPRSDSEAVHEAILAQTGHLTEAEDLQPLLIDKVVGTFLCTKTNDENDAEFLKTQQLLRRLLGTSKASRYPMVVFVCPETSSAHRSILNEQGAIVRELGMDLGLAPFYTDDLPKLKDQLRILSLWSATEYRQILFVEPDAAIHNINQLLDDAVPQQCDLTKMLEESLSWRKDVPKSDLDNLCQYTFKLFQGDTESRIEDSTFILSPNRLMYRRLIEYAQRPETFAALRMGMIQAVHNVAFRRDGPFPAQYSGDSREIVQPDSRWRLEEYLKALWR